MSDQIISPSFTDWPPHDNFKGKVLHNIIKVFLRMKVDAEWRRDMHNDSSHYDWLMAEYDIQSSIDYCIVASHLEEERVIKWTNCIKDRYDWSQKD